MANPIFQTPRTETAPQQAPAPVVAQPVPVVQQPELNAQAPAVNVAPQQTPAPQPAQETINAGFHHTGFDAGNTVKNNHPSVEPDKTMPVEQKSAPSNSQLENAMNGMNARRLGGSGNYAKQPAQQNNGAQEINVARPYQSTPYTYGQDKTGADAAKLFGTDAPNPTAPSVSASEQFAGKPVEVAPQQKQPELNGTAPQLSNSEQLIGPGVSVVPKIQPELNGKISQADIDKYDWSKYGNVNWSANGGDFMTNIREANIPISDAIRFYNKYQEDHGGKPLDWLSMYSTVSRYDPTRSLKEQQKEDALQKQRDQWEKLGNLFIHAGNFLGTTKGAPSMQGLESGQELSQRQQANKERVEQIRQAAGQRFLQEMQLQRNADIKQQQAEQKAWADGQKYQIQQKNLELKNELAKAKIANDTKKIDLIQTQIDRNEKEMEQIDQKMQYYGRMQENIMKNNDIRANAADRSSRAQMIQAGNGTLHARTNADKAEGDTSGEHKEETTGYNKNGEKATTTVTKTNAQVAREEAAKKAKEEAERIAAEAARQLKRQQ